MKEYINGINLDNYESIDYKKEDFRGDNISFITKPSRKEKRLKITNLSELSNKEIEDRFPKNYISYRK